MTTFDLTPEQMTELKGNFISETFDALGLGDPSYGALFASADIPDEIIREVYDGIDFSDDDFFCTAR